VATWGFSYPTAPETAPPSAPLTHAAVIDADYRVVGRQNLLPAPRS
jgi:hypothetical protein